MGNFNIDLNINAKSLVSSSKSGVYEEVINTSRIVDNTDAGTILLTGSSSLAGTNAIKSSKGLMLKNSGLVGAEIFVKLDTWAEGTPDTNATDAPSFLSYILASGEFMFLPSLRQVAYSTTNSAANGGTMDNVNPSQLSGSLIKSKASGATLGAHITTNDGTDITVSDSDFFKVNDLIQLGTTEDTGAVDSIEIMKVVAIPDDTSLTVERALYGSFAGDQNSGSPQSTGHASGAAVYLPFFNTYANQDKYTTPRTDSGGKYWAMNLFGYGRTASEGDGFVPGSISGKFYQSGYQELGVSGLTSSTDTRLEASTAYSFNINCDGAGNIVVAFTTSTNTTLGGSDGVIAKIQTALDALTNAASGTLAGLNVKVAIVGGDLRFTSLQRHSTSSIALVKATSSLFDTTAKGIFPIDTNLQQAVGASLPDDVIYDKKTYASSPNVASMFYDDGFGNIKGACAGSINYETGEILLVGAPVDSDFVISSNYNSAHSGGNEYDTELGNAILEIKGRSLNSKINTTIDVMVVR